MQQEIVYRKIHYLHFDSDNPRLPVRIRGNQDLILDWMVENEKIVELMISIGEKGYFAGEPMLIVKHPAALQEFQVIEGNRRLAAVKLLQNPDLTGIKKKSVQAASQGAEYMPDEVPTLEFPEREDILSYLGYRHITGVEVWDALAKARYLKQLFEWRQTPSLEETYSGLAKSIGSRTDYVKRLLTGLAVYEEIEKSDYYGIEGLNEETIDFAVLTTALSYKNIAKFVGLDEKEYPEIDPHHQRLEKLTRWIFERGPEGRSRLGESRNLKWLSAVVANTRALARFERGEPLEQAAMLTDIPERVFQESLLQAKKQLLVAQRYLHEVKTLEEVQIELLQDAERLVRDLLNAVKARIGERDKDA